MTDRTEVEVSTQENSDEEARFTEEKIIGVRHSGEAGAKVPELCRRNGISEAT